jgi:hypothetical protein
MEAEVLVFVQMRSHCSPWLILFSNLLQVILSTSSFQMSMFIITDMDNQSNIFVCKKLYVCSVFCELNYTIGMNEVSSLA